jgi:hypothetical protein
MPNVAVNQRRICAIVCQTPPSEGGRVYLKILDSTNTSLTSLVLVNKEFDGVGQNPDVCIDNTGIATVVWEQFIDTRIRVGLARFNTTGIQIGSTQILRDDHSLADQLPRIAGNPRGDFIVVWQAMNDGIQAQFFSHTGEKRGKIFRVSHAKSVNPQFPGVRMDHRNRTVVVWQEGSSDDFQIKVRMYDSLGKPSKIVRADQAKGTAYFSNPEILFPGNGTIIVSWKDYRTGESNIFSQIYSKILVPLNSNIRINDDTGRQWQRLPRFAGNEGPTYALVWEDYRNNPNNQIGDIYIQRFQKNGTRIGSNRKVEVPFEPTSQRFPTAAMESNGELLVAWSDTRNDNSAIYLTRFDPQGIQRKEETRVFP